MAYETVHETQAIAQRLLAKGDHGGAIDVLNRVLRTEPDEGQLWALLGVAQWAAGEVIESIASLETALTLVPLGSEGRLALALGYEKIGKRELATDLYAGLVTEESLPYDVLEPLSRALARSRQPGLALEVCQRAVAERPDDPGPLRGVAFYMTRLDREPEEILPVLFRAFHLDPEDFDTRIQLARRLYECGRSTEAAYLLSVVEIESSCCPSCLNAMREIFAAAGDTDNAARCVEALLMVAMRDDSDRGSHDE